MTESVNDQIPLCVDLDGTLVQSDTLVESALLLIKANPFYLFAMLLWLAAGKANLKHQIAQRTKLNVAALPFNGRLLEWLKQQHASGRKLVLVTASNQLIADAVGAHLPIFSRVIGSSSTHNLSAGAKRDELDRRYGERCYDYVGNSRDDLKVWSSCRRAVLVNTSATVASSAARMADVEARFPFTVNPWFALFKAMRPRQWSKNLLIFVSILIAHTYWQPALLFSTVIAFIAFCLCSSAVYLINDLLDLEVDRKHKEKCHRAFASGQAPLVFGLIATPVLLLLAVILASIAGWMFLAVLAFYFAITLAYSFYLKRLALLDVLILAMLYTLRIIAGASVAGAMPSVWLVSFSLFFFTSLAMAKRYAELKSLESECSDDGSWASGRGYSVSDIPIIAQLGAASGYISTLVMALYIDSPDLSAIYANQQLMWLLCPLLMYWVGRIWLVASRGELDQDPVVFATRDRVSYVVAGLGFLTLLAAL